MLYSLVNENIVKQTATYKGRITLSIKCSKKILEGYYPIFQFIYTYNVCLSKDFHKLQTTPSYVQLFITSLSLLVC
jgi:hypothetical protein